MTMISITINVQLIDELAFRSEAVRVAQLQGMNAEDAALFSDPDEYGLGECAQMIFEPGTVPPGCSIQGGQTEVSDAGDQNEIVYSG